MTIKDAVGAGALALGLTASVAVAQQIQISGSGRQFPPVQQGTVADAAGAGAASTAIARAGFADAGPLVLNNIVDGKYVSGLLLRNAYCGDETVSLTAQLLDRDNKPYPISVSVERNDTTTTGNKKDASAKAGIAAQDAGEETTPGSTRWTMAPGSHEAIVLTINDPTAGASANPAGVNAGSAVWAALLSRPIDYGTWTGRLPLKGELVLSLHTSPTSGDPKGPCLPPVALSSNPKRDLKLQPPAPSPVDTGVILGSLGLALLATLFSAAITFRSTEIYLLGRMGDVNFDFTRSWGANVAIGAGLLAMLTGGTLLSQDQYSSNSTTYVVLGGLFAALVPLGATLYGLIRPPVSTGATTEPQGFVVVYLISSAIVLWGAIGQLLLIGMILREFELARVLSSAPAELLILITKGLIVVLIVYAILNALATVSTASERVVANDASTPRPQAKMI